jgi:hypothetical protein
MKAAKVSWMITVIAVLFLVSCSRQNDDFPVDEPQIQNRLNSSLSVSGVEGTYSSFADDCIPPAGNCFNSSRVAPSQTYFSDLESSVINNSVFSFVQTDEGKQFLTGLDSKVANDLMSGNTTIMKFSGRYFAVYPGATGPYDGPNYGQGGAPFKASEIPN